MSSNQNKLSNQYQQKTEKEHILHAPDTYIGSIEHAQTELDIFDEETQKMLPRTINFVPALYKLFDEGIVNSRDHVVRVANSTLEDKSPVTHIDISISLEGGGTITIENNGDGIDIAKHPETNLWIPEMIFGHLRTSTNYNAEEKKIVGGKNGFGFKLVLIWSTYGCIETLDHRRHLLYRQEFRDNLNVLGTPTITKTRPNAKPYTRVTFRPDYARLGLPEGLSQDMLQLFKKRACDIAAITDSKIRVTFNQAILPVKQFSSYAALYAQDAAKIHECPNPRWEYAVILSPTQEFRQVSFVNGIATTKGGKHVDYIMGQITRAIVEAIEKKHKIRVAPQTLREQLMLFLRCDIENPSFESQSKDYLSTPVAKFGSSCEVSPGFIKKVLDLGVANTACSMHELRENSKTAKKANGQKTKTLRGIEKLDDAILAGGPRSQECLLILCEGDSAKSGIISGLTKADRDCIGIYPLKGKLMNVRDQPIRKLAENKEIGDIIKILGLEIGKTYTSREDMAQNLRYGRVMLMCDQDVDGSHIKGLCLNLFHSHWPSLVTLGDFLSFMNTPILRATHARTKEVKVFYTDGEYQAWRQQSQQDQGQNPDSWKIKYFKGLGTSTAAEFKEYMSQKKIIPYAYTGEKSDHMIDIMFNKTRADDRKHLLLNVYQPEQYLDKNQATVSYEDFVQQELLHFSAYDCQRSIPHLVDGLKTSLRKILFCAFKRRLTSEIKVAQFSGYVSEHAEYHHGEQSLNGAIVSMAQNFVGSNNIPLFEPRGQFGSRLLGGQDSASERYIFTQLSPLTRALFPEADDAVLKYLNEDGHAIEPAYYVPILPFILINGTMGIGTGFSSNIPSFDPKQIAEYLMGRLRQPIQGSQSQEQSRQSSLWTPFYAGFRGTIHPVGTSKFLLKGRYEKISPTKIRITELPIGTWTTPYKTFLESLTESTTDKAGKKIPAILKDVVSHSTDTCVDMMVEFAQAATLTEWETESKGETVSRGDEGGLANGIEKHLKLTTTVSTTNMHLFDTRGKLRKYDSVQDIVEDYLPVRLATYAKRKSALLATLTEQYEKLSNSSRFVEELLTDVMDLRKKTAEQIDALMESRGYKRIEGHFKYLTKMSMDAVTVENVASLVLERDRVFAQKATLESKSLETLWIEDLDVFTGKYSAYLAEMASVHATTAVSTVSKTTKKQKQTK